MQNAFKHPTIAVADDPFPAHVPAVTRNGREPCESGGLFSGDLSELAHPGDQHHAEHRPDSGNGPQDCGGFGQTAIGREKVSVRCYSSLICRPGMSLSSLSSFRTYGPFHISRWRCNAWNGARGRRLAICTQIAVDRIMRDFSCGRRRPVSERNAVNWAIVSASLHSSCVCPSFGFGGHRTGNECQAS